MSLHFIEFGNPDGETVVFIHACAVGSWTWYAQLPGFRDYHCITVDLPEHGLSVDDTRFTIQSSVSGVVDIIRKHAHGGKAYLIGHETGAKIALEIVKNHENLVKKAVISSVVLRDGIEVRMHKILPHSLILGAFKLKKLALKTRSFQRLAAKEYGVIGEENRDIYLGEAKTHSAEWLVRIIQECYLSQISLDGLEKVETPTLIFVGDKEPQQTRESAKDLYNIMKNRKMVVVKDGTHAHPRLHSETFNQSSIQWFCQKSL